MRIAVLCSDIGVRVPGPKGASLHLQAITSALAAIGHDVLLIAVAGHDDPPPDVRSLLLPHPGCATGLRRETRKLRFTAALPRRVGPALAAFAPDVAYERLSLFGTAGRRLALARGLPHVVEVNTLLAREESQWRGLKLGGLARRRERDVMAGAILRIAVSDEVAESVRAVAPGPATLVVPNGVDARALARLPGRSEARRALGLPQDAFITGFAGALRPWHGVEHAIAAIAEMPAPHHLAIAGDGSLRRELTRRAEELGAGDRVSWLGHLAHSRMPGFLAALDVAIAPYPALPGFSFSPLKVFEYLAAGVPTVASDIGQLRPLLAGGRGQLVTPGDPRELARACERVRRDPERWRDEARIAREDVLTAHSWEDRARTITDGIREVLGDAVAA